jgi:probable phosphomutase (TIGR03848 family)
MPMLLLIRHGENEYTKKGRLAGYIRGVHLNEHGLDQARQLADSLKSAPVKALYASPLERARETAKPIAEALGLELQLEKGLMETDVGDWQGRSLRRLALNGHWKIVQGAPSRAHFPNGESFYQCQTRVVTALDRICTQHKSGDLIAIVFHADPIRLAVAHYLGLPLDHFQRLSCDTGSVSLLAVGEGSARLIWLNRRPPFELSSPHKKKR